MRTTVQVLSENARRSGWYAFFLGWGILVLSLVVFSMLTVIAGTLIGDLQAIATGEIETSSQMWLMRIFQGSSQLLTWGLAGLAMAYLLGGPASALGLKGPPDFKAILLGIALMIMSLPLVAFVTIQPDAFNLPVWMEGIEAWMQSMETANQGLIEDMLSDTHPLSFIGNVLILAVIPAICEEVFFRGFLQQTLARKVNPHVAVWLAAAIFSLVHLQFYGFFARTLLGAVLGYLLMGSRSLIPSIVAHFCFNFISILLFFVAYETEWLDPEVVMNDSYEVPIGLVVLSFAGLAGLLIFFLRMNRSQAATAESR